MTGKIKMHELKRWAKGKTLSVEVVMDGYRVAAHPTIERLVQLVQHGKEVEFITKRGDISTIARECLEELYLTGKAFDEEYNIGYLLDEEE